MTARRPTARPAGADRFRPDALVATAAVTLLAGLVPATVLAAGDPAALAVSPELQPTVHYEEAMEHAGDRIAFAAGDRVTVPFTPRRSDRWSVDGARPQPLPAGRATGRAIRDASAPPGAGLGVRPRRGLGAIRPDGAASAPGAAVGSMDAPNDDPSLDVPADLVAAVEPGGLKREVFGWLPYWELTDSSTRLDWATLSTVAYFGVGAAGNGDLQRRNADGSTTVGWSGWTSAKMTTVINAAHAHGTRVVLTIQSFAWSSSGVTRQKALLGSPGARANLARQIAAAVRDRGVDGVNLDFEPVVSTYADEFTSLVRSIRAELDKFHKGYQLTFDTTGWIGNYPLEAATAPGGADAVVIMGYDYRTGSSKQVGSVAPIGGPTYDVTDTVKDFLSRLPASRVILGVPYYGRAWSTSTDQLHATNVSGTKNGASVTVVYGTARQFAVDHGRRWDAVEGAAWTAYKRQNCTAAYGCVTAWRQLYFDDAQALKLKYDVINRYNLRGAGIWALGYDGSRTELYQALKDKFITDTIPPVITGSTLSTGAISPNGDGRLDTTTVKVSATAYLSFGWSVQPIVDGVAGRSIRSGSLASKAVAFTWDGKTGTGAVVGDGTYRITVWVADASNNRSAVQNTVIVDRRSAVVNARANATFLSPNGDGHNDTSALSWAADEPLSGTARILSATGTTIRKWSFSNARSASWTWNGRGSDGRVVADGRYALRVGGFDRAGNPTVRNIPVTVDRSIRSVTWSQSSFTPGPGRTDRFAVVLGRHVRLSASMYLGSTLVRRVWTNQPVDAGTYRWTWNGRTATGAWAAPGTYRVVVDAASGIGWSRYTRSVTVLAR
jgi:spore germination protein YaaH/flagellar hook assembly protein FlgD